MKLSLEELGLGAGVESLSGYEGTPDDTGVLERYELSVPAFERACYYANFQRYDPAYPGGPKWPNGANRCQPLRVTDFSDLRYGGSFLLLDLADGGALALLPLSGATTLTWLSGEGNQLVLNLGTLGTAPAAGDLPLYAWSRAADVYTACRRVWEAAIGDPLIGASTRMRAEKRYPDIFKYLGWCSWEEFHAAIDADLLLDAADKLDASPLPIRYMLVDDGHLDHDDKRRLASFETNEKFPNGWRDLMAKRSDDGLSWFGLWLNFNGYWNGVAPENRLGDLDDRMLTNNAGAKLPDTDPLSSTAFYDAMIAAARKAGYDFVKVDNQSNNLALYRGTESPTACAVANQQALETACARHMDGLINCMAHGTACYLNTRLSVVNRCSEDYKLNDLACAKRHLHNSYGNLPWLGQTMWGDHDMFHSNDPVCGRMMAVSKAVSGGPIYLSDAPDAFVPGHVSPLCYEDGELLRPVAPATPTADCVFANPFEDDAPYKAVAPLEGGATAVVAYNLTEPEKSVSGAITRDDYLAAGALVQGDSQGWAPVGDDLLVYDWYEGTGSRLDGEYPIELDAFSDRLLLLCPIVGGWAIVGRPDKYLSPAAVEVIRACEREITVRMKESGPLLIWKDGVSVDSEDCALSPVGGGFWRAALPVGPGERVVRLRRVLAAR